MSHTVEKISGNKVKISFSIPAEEFEEAVQQAYLKTRGRIGVPGFRKGKAPRKLIESMYGEKVFFDDAIELLFPAAYEAAVKENDLHPVDRPEADVQQAEKGQELQFSVEVFVRPDVSLGEYKGVKVARHVRKITEDQIESRIDRDVEKASSLQDIEDRPVQDGDTVNLDYAGAVDGVAFEGGTAQGQTLVIGSGSFIPGFEEQMVGMAIGEEKDLNVKFPDEYHAENLKGKDAVFHVKVNGIQVKVKPEVSDDFAADVSEFNTLDEYKAGIRAELQKAEDERESTQVENDAIQAVTDASDCDIPDAMVEDEIDTMLRQMQMRMAYQGIKFEDYLKYTGQSESDMRQMYHSDALNRVKTELVINAVKDKENITATEDEIEAQIKEQAERMGRELDAFKESLTDEQRAYIADSAAIKKTIDLIVGAAVIEDKEDSGEQLTQEDVQSAAQQVAQAAEALDPEEN